MKGHKFLLVELRRKLHELKYMRANNGDKDVSVRRVVDRLVKEKLNVMQRTRQLMMWHDPSTVANHSHLVLMDGNLPL